MGKAARLFNGSAEYTLYNRITPSSEQREFLQEQWNALADHLKARLSQDNGYPISTWLQGSYKYATLIKPVHLGEEYDVDVGVYFEWSRNQKVAPAPKQLRDWVQRELIAYQQLTAELKQVEEPPKERCSRAKYVKHFHIDTPVYHLERDQDSRRLACWSNKWEASDPKALYKWFKAAVPEENREQLRRIVRYLKAWAAVAFEDAAESRPSSILLTVLVTEEVKRIVFWSLFSTDDEDLLIEVVEKIHDRLHDDEVVLNPVDREENLNRISQDHWENFLLRLRALHDCAQHAKNSADEAAAALIWSEAFSFLMPLPEAEEVEVAEEGSSRALMQLPEIQIDVYSRNPRRQIATFHNEVYSVAKNCDLEFRITNPQIIPSFAVIEWTVRNVDREADEVGDLGHRRGGIRELTAVEHTKYAGRHFMDCIVRMNGSVYGVRRVPVTIRDMSFPSRNPPKPAYAKLRSLLRRRR
jgi:hypothetical protein